MKIIPYKQSLTHSCLSACFLMIINSKKGVNFNDKDEQRIALHGSSRNYDFYITGITSEIVKEYKVKVKIYVDNKYFTNILQKSFSSNLVEIVHQKITINFIKKILKDNFAICHVDINPLGDYSHSSHFVVLESLINKKIKIIDPWNGEKSNINNLKLEKAINSLKTQVKMCPLLLTFEE